MRVVLGGDNVPPLVEIGLIDLSKSGGAPAPPLATGLISNVVDDQRTRAALPLDR